jgi:hypothetical protein
MKVRLADFDSVEAAPHVACKSKLQVALVGRKDIPREMAAFLNGVAGETIAFLGLINKEAYRSNLPAGVPSHAHHCKMVQSGSSGPGGVSTKLSKVYCIICYVKSSQFEIARLAAA